MNAEDIIRWHRDIGNMLTEWSSDPEWYRNHTRIADRMEADLASGVYPMVTDDDYVTAFRV